MARRSILIDDARDPENAKELEQAAKLCRDNPNGILIHHIIVCPPNGEPDWERYMQAGTNIQVAEEQSLAREALLSKWKSRQRSGAEH